MKKNNITKNNEINFENYLITNPNNISLKVEPLTNFNLNRKEKKIAKKSIFSIKDNQYINELKFWILTTNLITIFFAILILLSGLLFLFYNRDNNLYHYIVNFIPIIFAFILSMSFALLLYFKKPKYYYVQLKDTSIAKNWLFVIIFYLFPFFILIGYALLKAIHNEMILLLWLEIKNKKN